MRLKTGKTMFGYDTTAKYHQFLSGLRETPLILASLDLLEMPDSIEDAAALPAAAVANQGRWIVRCPEPRCGGGVAAQPGVWFLCPMCFNRDIGFYYRRVLWSEDTEAIDAVLAARPDVLTRNYEVEETLAMLRLENAQHEGAVS